MQDLHLVTKDKSLETKAILRIVVINPTVYIILVNTLFQEMRHYTEQRTVVAVVRQRTGISHYSRIDALGYLSIDGMEITQDANQVKHQLRCG
jgi:hypothetical protein